MIKAQKKKISRVQQLEKTQTPIIIQKLPLFIFHLNIANSIIYNVQRKLNSNAQTIKKALHQFTIILLFNIHSQKVRLILPILYLVVILLLPVNQPGIQQI